jgi:hypothetical protein
VLEDGENNIEREYMKNSAIAKKQRGRGNILLKFI